MAFFGNRSKGGGKRAPMKGKRGNASTKGAPPTRDSMTSAFRAKRGNASTRAEDGPRRGKMANTSTRAPIDKSNATKGATAGPMTAPRTKGGQTATSQAMRPPMGGQTATSQQGAGPQAAGQAVMDRFNADSARMGQGQSPGLAQAAARAAMGQGMRPPMGQTTATTMGQGPRSGMMSLGRGSGAGSPMSQTAARQGAPGGMMRQALGSGIASMMATGGKVKVSEYGGKETYKSKAAMMKHEGKESPSMEKKEGRMAKGGKCRGMGAATKGGNYKAR